MFSPLFISVVHAGREGGPLASPLHAGRVWHQPCSIITAKSCWWKTLGLLRRAISINICAAGAGNRTKPSFLCLCRETEKIWCKFQMWAPTWWNKPPTQTEAAQECDRKTHGDSCETMHSMEKHHADLHKDLFKNWKIHLTPQTHTEKFDSNIFLSSNRMKPNHNMMFTVNMLKT